MSNPRYLIVNADDFGLTLGINEGIITAHRRGIVTSASLMVRAPAAREAAALAAEYSELSLGLHLDLGEWVYRHGDWVQLYTTVPDDGPEAYDREVRSQLAAFEHLTGASPTHIDSHQHVHRDDPLRAIVMAMGRDLRVPVRDFAPDIRYCGDFYGQSELGETFPAGISPDALLGILRRLGPGLTELGCHPGLPAELDSVYRDEREVELQALCDPRIRAALDDLEIELCSFATMPVTPSTS